MRIQVRYFAVVRERLRLDEESLELPAGATVSSALDALCARHEAIRTLRPYLQAAVNQALSSASAALAEGDELALIPPVAGGADQPPAAAARLLRVVSQPPSLDRCVAAVAHAGAGGIVTFIGMVRRHSQGKDVVRLEYEAYAAMAERTFTAIADELELELPGVRLAVEHRVGALAIGDIAVAIAASAPHRAEAFQACRAMIDRLKDRAPIWKKEFGPDGSVWVGLGP